MFTPPGSTEVPLALRLLDHQIDGPDGSALAKVDDVELELRPEGLVATAILCGPGALGERLPGRLGRWTIDAWRRLTLERYPSPLRIPLTEVRDISAVVVVTAEAARSFQQRQSLERWLLEHLVRRLPGAGAGAAPPTADRARDAADLDAAASSTPVVRLSTMLGAVAVTDRARPLGTVHEVTALRSSRTAPVIGPMPVNGYVVGPRTEGSSMGYDRHPEHGPWVLRVILSWLHRHDVQVPVDAVTDLQPSARRIIVAEAGVQPRRRRSSR